MEIFKDIKGYEGSYQVSNLGRVKSFNFGKKKIMNPSLSSNGYYQIGLRKEGKQHTKKIHQLVAIAFLNHSPDGLNIVVDHINNDKTNNKLDNLQLITHRENVSKDIKGYSSEYIGVHWENRRNKWISRIQINGKNKYLGSYTEELEASKAYQNALKEIT